MATSLARPLASLPADRQRAILGVSGGRDSTLAALVAARALDLLGLPRRNLIGATLPGFGTTEPTRKAARRMIDALGATVREVSITEIASAVFAGIGHDARLEDLTFENVQAWAHKMKLFAIASQEGGIDLGTGDLRDRALGWSTYGGDWRMPPDASPRVWLDEAESIPLTSP